MKTTTIISGEVHLVEEGNKCQNGMNKWKKEEKNVSENRARKNCKGLEREMKEEINEKREEEEERDSTRILKTGSIISAKFTQVKFT